MKEGDNRMLEKGGGRMTLEEIRSLDRDIITPDEAAGALHCDPQYIRCAAAQCPWVLGFPVIRIGNRTKIPRLAFLRFMEGEGTEQKEEAC